ncbi:hypothetical protein [Zunongwangia sp.]|uniref:hypothetical protein n=1 Tax=Zunongwangia sp. TaxID=1965325 RepID=UPI003AA9B56A
MRYGEIPVDYSTGVPNISIPIYTIEGTKLSFPITISYHASGIKVKDVSSEVGLGWVLNAGGLISRTTMGKRDKKLSYDKRFDNAKDLLDCIKLATKENPNDDNDYCLYNIIDLENWFTTKQFQYDDPMSDRFFYKLPNGDSGVFRYDYQFQNLITLPYKPIKISTIGNNINIKDENGILYNFNRILSNSSDEWFITEMTSADGTDKIKFHYSATDQFYKTSNVTYTSNSRSLYTNNINCSQQTVSSNPFNPNIYLPVLDSITSSKSTVKFIYKSDRQDFSSLNRLSEIVISSVGSRSEIIKQFKFNNDEYFGTTSKNKRLRLGSVEERGKKIYSDPQIYSFTYEKDYLPDYRVNGGKHNEDFWGYYNKSNSGYNVPSIFISEGHDRHYGSNRKANEYAKACMLKVINYPTGGKTVFDFERNFASWLYPSESDNKRAGYLGGFRVKSITNYSNANDVSNIKTYEYKSPVFRKVRREYFSYSQKYYRETIPRSVGCKHAHYKNLIYSEPFLPLEVAPGMPIMYREVIEYNGTLTEHAGKTIYTYEKPYSPYKNSYTSSSIDPSFEELRNRDPYHFDKGNYIPKMISKKVYELNKGTYYPVLEYRYYYSKLFTKSYHTGIKLTRPITFLDYPYEQFCFESIDEFSWLQTLEVMNEVKNNFINSFIALDTKAIQESTLLTSKDSYTYAKLDSTKYVQKTTDYTYNFTNLGVKEKTTTNSRGDKIVTTFKYPHDYSFPPYQRMKHLNILSPVIEQNSYKEFVSEKNLLFKKKTTYRNWKNNTFAPELIQKQKGKGELINKIIFKHYDNKTGNLTEYQQADGTTITYLWGYCKGQYPVAKIKNATLASVEETLTRSELDAIKNGSYSMQTLINKLNKIRTKLPEAMVITYTYEPLIGITSITDPKGYTTYYEYDKFNRLKFMKDHDRKLLEENQYNYKKL